MAKHTITLDADVRTVLESSTFGRGMIQLPGTLDRKLYQKVAKVIEAAGGAWDRRAKAHTWTGGRDPKEALGLALATGTIVNTQTQLQQFFTPVALASQLCDALNVRGGQRVLEPSAGSGVLAKAAAARAAMVECVEIDERLAKALREVGFTVTCADFLSVTPAPVYDVVLMNPPFEKYQDIAHVLHAMQFLVPYGKLAAIMGAGVTFREDAKTRAFRSAFVAAGGFIEPLPPKSFASSGTDVNVVLATIAAYQPQK